jgi:predicted transposase/invertase (TIGR01784 family)
MDLASSQHDRFFRALMERPGVAGAFLRERLPSEIADQLVGDPVLVEGSFVDEEMRASQCDRLYRVKLRGGGEAFVYCLIEHKSTPDGKVALQLLRYMVRIWEREERNELLPAIYPLVVYHGRPKWRVPLRFSAMLAAPEEAKRHLLDFPFGLLDLGQVGDQELSRERELRAGLTVLKYSMRVTSENLEEVILRVLSQVRGASDELFGLVVRYMITAYEPASLGWRQVESAMRRSMSDREQEMLSRAARELVAEGEARGVAIGEARGVAIGEARGEAKALTRILERRFRALPEDVLKRIGSAAPGDLESWLDRAVDAPSLEAVFLGPSERAKH